MPVWLNMKKKAVRGLEHMMNSKGSSTNFLIISKEELTEEYLFEKLGFIKDGMLEKQGRELCRSIIYALDGGLRYHNYEIPDYESIKKVFGEKSAGILHNGYAFSPSTVS